MFSPLFVVETWLLTNSGSQFLQRGENVSGDGRCARLAANMTGVQRMAWAGQGARLQQKLFYEQKVG